MNRKSPETRAEHAKGATRHEAQLAAEAEEFLARSSGAAVEMRLVDPGDGQVRIVLTGASMGGVRRESYALDDDGLATWIRAKLTTYCSKGASGSKPTHQHPTRVPLEDGGEE